MSKKNCPDYYIGKYLGIEAMDVVFDFSQDNYNIGTALTYLMRAGKKPGNPMSQDIEKAIVHLQRELQHQLKNEQSEPGHDIQDTLRQDPVLHSYWRATYTYPGREE